MTAKNLNVDVDVNLDMDTDIDIDMGTEWTLSKDMDTCFKN